MTGEGSPSEESCQCKVGRVARDRELADIDETLERRWYGDGGVNRQSVRDLTEYFNRAVFRAVLDDLDRNFIEARVKSLYNVITSADVDEDELSEVYSELEGLGVDVDAVVADEFVSYQTVHNHLTDCLGLTAPTNSDGETDAAAGIQAIRGLQRRTETVAEDVLGRSASPSLQGIETVDVDVQVTVGCRDCGYTRSITRFLSDGGSCYCSTTPDEQPPAESNRRHGESSTKDGSPTQQGRETDRPSGSTVQQVDTDEGSSTGTESTHARETGDRPDDDVGPQTPTTHYAVDIARGW